MLVFIGLGLSTKHLTLEAIQYLYRVDKIIVDTYTNIVPDLSKELFEYIGREKEIIWAERKDLEGTSIKEIVEEARGRDIAIVVPGDPFIATTHDAIRVEALKQGVKVVVVNGLSIYSLAVSRTGLQAYRFGKTVTLVYPDYSKPYSVIDAIYDNLERNLHTLVLLDLRVKENKYMDIGEAIGLLLDMDEKNMLDKVIGIGLARIGCLDEMIVADKIGELDKYSYPGPPHSIIIVAKPHPIELDNLRYIAGLPYDLYEKYMVSRNYP